MTFEKYPKNTSPKKFKRQKILIDEYDKSPTFEFESLANTIANIIKTSHPRFTTGIYGEWGTGKTTLMKAIQKNLEDNDSESQQKVFPIWFNAWKYEREEDSATTAFLKTIGFALQGHVKFDSLSRVILDGLTTVNQDTKQKYMLDILANDKISTSEFSKKIEHLNNLEKQSIRFQGIDGITKEMKKIRDVIGEDYRIVVFIDDLDRCSSQKTLEVLEAMKVFLDIEGFIYVIGLSHNTVTSLITQSYKETGIKGEDYIKKIIQIPIRIPEWTHASMNDLLETRILPYLNDDYAKFLRQNVQIVSKVVGGNPRQLKRFINNVIIAFETFSSKEKPDDWILEEIFLVQILKTEWIDFYNEFRREKSFRTFFKLVLLGNEKEIKKLSKYIQETQILDPVSQKAEKLNLLTKLAEKTNSIVPRTQLEILADFDYETWGFLFEFQDVLFNIKRWKEIDRITEVVEEIPYHLSDSTDDKTQ